MHLFSQRFACVRRGSFQNFRIIVVQPFNPMSAIQRLDARAHPATKIAIAVGVNFDLFSIFHSFRSRTCPANDGTMADKSAF